MPLNFETSPAHYSAPLSQEIEKAYKTLEHLIAKIFPLNKEDENLDRLYSIKDIIAYQIGWGQLLIGWYESGIQQKKIIMPGEGFSTWDYSALADHFYQKYRLDSLIKQMALFDQTVQTILTFVEKEYKSGQLDKTGIWEWCTLQSGKIWPLSKWVQINTVAPYKRAAAAIKKLLLQNPSGK